MWVRHGKGPFAGSRTERTSFPCQGARVSLASARHRNQPPEALDGAALMNDSLVKEFPLEPIRDDDHLRQALSVVEGLLKRDLDRAAEAYLDVLSGLIEAYEDAAFSIPDASEADVLRELMR